ncbi:fungal specific transcription factor [Apiospora kogelbergensis]|uniref:fungal specific transcription factor n=1 Tax=Apiospora kogelbergensis TaxID=1337665 RepID=UPI00312FE043
MIDCTKFDRVFGSLDSFPYTRKSLQEADSHRRIFGGALFIDRVLAALGHGKGMSPTSPITHIYMAIETHHLCLSLASKLYPPKSEEVLRQLHEQITKSNSIEDHHKLSVIFYILLDFDEDKADSFANRAGVPTKYQIFMRGLWNMDRQAFEVALEHLAHPSLQAEFADDIVATLVRHGSQGGEDYTLALAYYHTVQPVLKNPVAIELLFDAMVRSNVSEALAFSRTKPHAMREQLFQRLVANVLDEARGGETAERACELAALPFDAVEEAWFRDFLATGNGKKLKAAKDTLMMRQIAIGQVTSAGEKGSWGTVMEGFKVGSGGRA